MAGMHQPMVDLKRQELEEAIVLCSGLWLDATADKYAAMPGGTLKISATALNREKLPVDVESVDCGWHGQSVRGRYGRKSACF